MVESGVKYIPKEVSEGDWVISLNDEKYLLKYGVAIVCDLRENNGELMFVSVKPENDRWWGDVTAEDFFTNFKIISEEEALKILKSKSENAEEGIRAGASSIEKLCNVQNEQYQQLACSKKQLMLGTTDADSSLDVTSKGIEGIEANLETVKNQVVVVKSEIEKQTKIIKGIMCLKAVQVSLMVNYIEGIAKTCHEAISRIKLYLGADEEVVQIRQGEPVEGQITVRQLMLYMDEECGLYIEEGGLSFDHLTDFDIWLRDNPEFIDTILPEKKGIVALRVRRYPDRISAFSSIIGFNTDQKDDPEDVFNNKKTYLLIRNGENLYRIWSSYNYGSRLFPKKSEIKKIFEKEKHTSFFDKKENITEETEYYSPTNPRFYKATDEAERVRQHYFRVLITLQGLIHRTKVLHPLDSFNILTVSDMAKAFKFVRDEENVLTSPYPSWKAFLEKHNEQIKVGEYVLFDSTGQDYDDESRRRKHPSSAGVPGSGYKLIEKREKDGYKFFYKYEHWYTTPVSRASWCIMDGDSNYIYFGEMKSEDLNWYLTNRLDRNNYLHLLPKMKMLKQHMEKNEQSKRDLLSKYKTYYETSTGKSIKDIKVSPQTLDFGIYECLELARTKNKVRFFYSDSADSADNSLGILKETHIFFLKKIKLGWGDSKTEEMVSYIIKNLRVIFGVDKTLIVEIVKTKSNYQAYTRASEYDTTLVDRYAYSTKKQSGCYDITFDKVFRFQNKHGIVVYTNDSMKEKFKVSEERKMLLSKDERKTITGCVMYWHGKVFEKLNELENTKLYLQDSKKYFEKFPDTEYKGSYYDNALTCDPIRYNLDKGSVPWLVYMESVVIGISFSSRTSGQVWLLVKTPKSKCNYTYLERVEEEDSFFLNQMTVTQAFWKYSSKTKKVEIEPPWKNWRRYYQTLDSWLYNGVDGRGGSQEQHKNYYFTESYHGDVEWKIEDAILKYDHHSTNMFYFNTQAMQDALNSGKILCPKVRV